MKAGVWLNVLLAIVLCVSIAGCNGSSGSSDSSSASSSNGSDNDSSGDADIPDDTAPALAHDVTIDFTANTARVTGGTDQTITEGGVTLITEDGTSVIVRSSAYGITVSSTVAAVVAYTLTGALNGTLSVESASDYQLNLNGVAITSADGPALDLESKRKVFIVSASGTTNTLRDSSTSAAMDKKGALFGKGPMVFSGDGSISVNGNYKHGIYSNDYIHMKGGTLDVTVSARDAVRSVNGFICDGGSLAVTGTGTSVDDESKGIKVEGDDDTTDGAGKGYVVINGGAIAITTVGKAITAGWDIDEDLGDNTSGNPDPYVEINGGVIDITTTGTPYENADGASLSPEGIEGKSGLTINGGYITLDTTEDALNAGGPIAINGGYLYCKAGTDAIDANGPLTISGGVIVAIGGNQPEGPFDCDNNTFAVTGGTVVGIGGTTSRPTVSACTQNVVVLGSLPGGRTMAIRANDGRVAFAFTVPQSYTTMVLSSPEIAAGDQCTIYTGGTAAGDDEFYGLFLGTLGYTGGTASGSFTVSSMVTHTGGVFF